MIELKNISKSFKDQVILKDINITIHKGDFIMVTGASGSGKSTLLNIIGKLESFDSGTITFSDSDLNAYNDLKLRKDIFAYIFQNYALVDNYSVKNNLKIVAKSKKNSPYEEVLKKVGLSKLILDKKIAQLSGGEQQRVAISRVLLKKYEILLADEPTGNLDNKNKHEVYKLLSDINKLGKTIICVSHDDDLSDYANRIIVLRDGEIFEERRH